MLLSDDDPENDRAAYYDLAHVLLAAGDETNAMAVFHLCHSKFPDEKANSIRHNSKNAQESKEKPNGNGNEKENVSAQFDVATEEVHEDEETKEAESKGDKPELEENARISIEELMASAWELSDDRASLCNGADWLFDERAWICDGQCGRRYGNHTDSNVCRYCLVDLCEEDCVTLLEKGSD